MLQLQDLIIRLFNLELFFLHKTKKVDIVISTLQAAVVFSTSLYVRFSQKMAELFHFF